MSIYRIVARRSGDRSLASAENDQFVAADSKSEARDKFQPQGTLDTIDSVAETPFERIDDPKYYLVGMGHESLPSNYRIERFLLVQAINGKDARSRVEASDKGYTGANNTFQDIHYLGKFDPSKNVMELSHK